MHTYTQHPYERRVAERAEPVLGVSVDHRGRRQGGCRERGARGNGVEPTSAGSSPHKSGKEQEKRVGWQLTRAFLLCAVLFCFVLFLGLRET